MEIILKNLSKVFKEAIAVDDLNIKINDGELVSILGPSGCGKSTTLSMIAGLEIPTSGTIYFDGEIMNDIAAECRDIGMVFQNYALYPHMTVLHNIIFPLKMKKMKKNYMYEKAMEIAELMQIKELINRKPAQLSGGQQQRVAIARALIKKPKILLLDEPLSNLDARLRIELRDEIRSLQKKLKITTIFVTHDQEEAMSISDKILLMDKGFSKQYSTPKEMYTEPKNEFVASFLGNPPMNFFLGSYDLSRKLPYIKGTGNPIYLSNDHLKKYGNYENKEFTLGIRPEDFIIVKENGELTGEIESIQTLGKEIYIKMNIGDFLATACVSWDNHYEVGQKIGLKIKKSHIFESQGVNIENHV